MDAIIAITVSDVQLTGGMHDHLGRFIEWTRRPRHQRAVLFAASIRMFTPLSQNRERSPIERELQGDVIITVGEVDKVVTTDVDAMWIFRSHCCPTR